MKILFFSRGRGFGHAIPDIEIAREIIALRPGVEIVFASYSSGAELLRKRNQNVIDLQLPEANPYLATLERAQALIARLSPEFVIAHEEFSALYAARRAGVRCAYIAAWLPPPGSISSESLLYCDGIVVIGFPGLFSTSPFLRVKPRYVGPVLRPVLYTIKDRDRLRKEAGIGAKEHVTVVVPGAAVGESHAPIANLVISAFLSLSGEKRIYWVSRNDYDLMKQKMAGVSGFYAVEFMDPIEKLIAAADVVITRGTRGITFDAAAVGVPSISLSNGNNPIDDAVVARISSNTALNLKAIDPEIMAAYIMAAKPRRYDGAAYFPFPSNGKAGAQLAAEALIDIAEHR